MKTINRILNQTFITAEEYQILKNKAIHTHNYSWDSNVGLYKKKTKYKLKLNKIIETKVKDKWGVDSFEKIGNPYKMKKEYKLKLRKNDK